VLFGVSGHTGCVQGSLECAREFVSQRLMFRRELMNGQMNVGGFVWVVIPTPCYDCHPLFRCS